MANGGANTSRGMGRGAAQVYDTSGPVNAYARLMYQQQLRRAAEQKSLTDKLDKFDSKGVRIQDREGLNKVYEDWQKAGIEALKATDRNEKFRLNAEAQSKLNIAEQFVYDSKAKTQRDLAVGAKILGKPYFFSEEGKKIFEKSLSAPIYSQDDIADYSTIPLGHDKSKVAKDIAAVNESLLKTAKYDVSQGVEKKVGDLTYAEFAKIKRVSQEEQIKGYELLYNVNDGFQALLEENYSDLDWDNNKVQALQTALTDFSAKYPLIKDEGVTRSTIPNREMTDYQRRRLALAGAKGGADEEIGNIEVNKEFFGQSTTTTSGKEIEKPVKTISFDYFIKPTQKNFASTQLNNVLNLSTGKNGMMGADTNAALIGLGYTKTKGGKLQIKAVVVNSDKIEFAINEMDLPITVRNSDEYRAARNKLNSEYKRLQQSKPTTKPTSGKVTTMSAIKALVGKKGYEGYTEKELMDYYKSQGYSIK